MKFETAWFANVVRPTLDQSNNSEHTVGQSVRWQCPKCEQWYLVSTAGKKPRSCSRCRKKAGLDSAASLPPAISTDPDFDSVLSQAAAADAPGPEKSAAQTRQRNQNPTGDDGASQRIPWQFAALAVGVGSGILATSLLVFGILSFRADEDQNSTADTPPAPSMSKPPISIAQADASPLNDASNSPASDTNSPKKTSAFPPVRRPIPVAKPSTNPDPAPQTKPTPTPVSPPNNAIPKDETDSKVAANSGNAPNPMPSSPAEHGNGILALGGGNSAPASDEVEKAKLKEIDRKREALIQKRSELNDKIAVLNGEAAGHQLKIKQLQAESSTLNNNLNVIRAQLAGVSNQLQAQRITPQEKAILEQQGRALVTQGQNVNLAIQKVNAEAAATSTKLEGVARQVAISQRDLAGLQQKADALRDEWLEATDPFGKLDRGEGLAAIAVLDKLIAIQKDFVQAYVARGLAHYSLKHYDLAIKDFEEALRLKPNYPPAMAGKALALSIGVSRTKGRLAFRDAVRYGKDSWFVYLCNGIAEQNHGDYGKAMAHFEKATKLGSSEPAAFHYLGRLQAGCPEAEWRNGTNALAAATKANSLSEGRVWIYIDTLAAAYAERGEFSKAIEFQKDALALAPQPAADACRQRLLRYENGQPFRLP